MTYDPDRQANAYYKSKFGITLAEYNAMSEAQGHVCYICKQPEQGKRLAVDHCHSTGKLRKLLCQICNRRVGRYELRKLFRGTRLIRDYLKEFA